MELINEVMALVYQYKVWIIAFTAVIFALSILKKVTEESIALSFRGFLWVVRSFFGLIAKHPKGTLNCCLLAIVNAVITCAVYTICVEYDIRAPGVTKTKPALSETKKQELEILYNNQGITFKVDHRPKSEWRYLDSVKIDIKCCEYDGMRGYIGSLRKTNGKWKIRFRDNEKRWVMAMLTPSQLVNLDRK